MSRTSRLQARSVSPMRRRLWPYSLLTAIGMIFVGVTFLLSGLSGDQTMTYMYSHPNLLALGKQWFSDDWRFPSEGVWVENRAVTIKDHYFSGESMTYAPSPNARIDVSFEGTEIQWWGYAGPYGGKAEIYVDGKYAGTADQYSAIPAVRLMFQSETLGAGKHTLTLQNTLDKHASSLGNALHVDKFLVRNLGQEHTIENEDTSVVYVSPNDLYYYQFILRKLAHLTLYALGTVSMLLTVKIIGLTRRSWWVVALLMVGMAAGDEWHQAFVPGRHAQWLDVAIDSVGVILGFLLALPFILRKGKGRG
jgi:VanZ family protein